MAPLQQESKAKSWMQVWGDTAWWIVTVYSIPFGLYSLPFIYGDQEIYKYMTIQASRGDMEGSGNHIRDHLRTWQLHALGALLFMIIGPFQFNAGFRAKHPVLHKRMGYTFALCTIVTAVSGGAAMPKDSELGPLAKSVSPYMGIGALVTLAISIVNARNKRFQSHRRWMMRSAAIGYSVMYTRVLPSLVEPLLRVSAEDALDLSFPISLALNSGLAEIYIQMYLTQPDRKRAAGGNSEKAL